MAAECTCAPKMVFRSPSRYRSRSSPSSSASPAAPPPLAFLHRTWSVTHSTLEMWRKARNVRITYFPIASAGSRRMKDVVEYESLDGKGSVRSVIGVDTATSPTETDSWDWRGNGWLFWVTSHWEVLGWGEHRLSDGPGSERWVVTWFASTVFTAEGVDVYSDRPEGPSPGLAAGIMDGLKGMEAKTVADLCDTEMRPVVVSLPWKKR